MRNGERSDCWSRGDASTDTWLRERERARGRSFPSIAHLHLPSSLMTASPRVNMDLPDSDSDEEELPTNLDVTTPRNAHSLTASTLTDRTLSHALPPSPRTAKKRTNEEVYQRSQIPIASTTPLKTPPKRMSQFERMGFDSLPTESQATAVATQAEPQSPVEQAAQAKTFVQEIQAYQDQLEDEFKQFEKSLSDRDKKEPLEELDWDELEHRYRAEIGPKEADEQAIIEELQTRFQACYCLHSLSLRLTGLSNSSSGCKSRKRGRASEPSRGMMTHKMSNP